MPKAEPKRWRRVWSSTAHLNVPSCSGCGEPMDLWENQMARGEWRCEPCGKALPFDIYEHRKGAKPRISRPTIYAIRECADEIRARGLREGDMQQIERLVKEARKVGHPDWEIADARRGSPGSSEASTPNPRPRDLDT